MVFPSCSIYLHSSTFEDPPSESDLTNHLQLIKEAALRDKDIAKAKVCVSTMHGNKIISILKLHFGDWCMYSFDNG